MRITTWNINGLRAALGKGLLESIKSIDPDVLCLQEIKARPEQLLTEATEGIKSLYSHLSWSPGHALDTAELLPGLAGILCPLNTDSGQKNLMAKDEL